MTNSNQPSSHTAVIKRPVRKQLWFDSIARAIITSGGVGTILVAFLIVVVMISQLLPLLATSEVKPLSEFRIHTEASSPTENTVQPTDQPATTPVCAGMDEYGDI
ncbi:MAG: hypothetical protein ACK5T6_11605, partial [Pirellula sp.]